MLRAIDTNLWVAEQPLRYLGLSVGTRMTVIRLKTGDLVLISPIQGNPSLFNQLNHLGPVRHLIAPNLFHHFFIESMQAHFPQAQLWAGADLQLKKPQLWVDHILQDGGGTLWGEVEYLPIMGMQTFGTNGFSPLKECVFFHAISQTLVLTDTAFHYDQSFPWLTQLATQVLGAYLRLSPSRLEKLASRDKLAIQRSIQRILKWDFQRVIVAHGSIVDHDAKAQLLAGYEWFLETNLTE